VIRWLPRDCSNSASSGCLFVLSVLGADCNLLCETSNLMC